MNIDVLILSSLYDFSTDLITQQLEKSAIPYFRLNKEHFSEYRVTLDPINIKMSITIDDEVYFIDSSLKSILYRQPVFLRNTPGSRLSPDEQLRRSQWMAFLRSLQVFSEAIWMNQLDATYLAETKAYQLMVAKKLGFNVPKTIIGNNVNDFKSLKNQVIIKSLDTVLLMDEDDCLFTYSTISSTQQLTDEEIFDAPLTIQEYIFPKVDIRVTIIGGQIFSVKITSQGKGIDEDWRIINRDNVEYTDITLPLDIEKKCFALMKLLNLNFGAIDLIQKNHEYYFVEINPTGEWGWLVSDKRRIDLAISNWLMASK